MKPKTKASLLSAALVLTACGGGGSTGGGSAEAALDYAPVYADGPTDTTIASVDGEGLTGVMSQADISASSVSTRLRSVKVRLSPDGNTAFLTVDGETQSRSVTIIQPGGGQFGNVPSKFLSSLPPMARIRLSPTLAPAGHRVSAPLVRSGSKPRLPSFQPTTSFILGHGVGRPMVLPITSLTLALSAAPCPSRPTSAPGRSTDRSTGQFSLD